MTEKLFQFIWQFQYLNRSELKTINGETVEILFPGYPNTNQGPDFSDARIRISETLMAGSVELHLKTSDWKRHGHDGDANYNNVILHVVYHHDQLFAREIPILELSGHISKLMLDKYEMLMDRELFIPCGKALLHMHPLALHSWKERLLAERLIRKSEGMLQMLAKVSFHWEEVFWRLIARNFGLKVNAEAFEAVAVTLPVALLARHKQRIHQLEALLLGQAGLLADEIDDAYYSLLQREYRFLRKKYGLQASAIPMHFHRLRPVNFPTVRLAQLAALLQGSQHLFSKFLESGHVRDLKALLQVQANDYWHYHYRFGQESSYMPKKLGEAMTDNIIINTVAPVVFAYGLHHGKEDYKVKALQWLEETAAESNSIIGEFEVLGMKTGSAFDSQALLELKNEYCNYRRCLSCAVGNALLKREAAY